MNMSTLKRVPLALIATCLQIFILPVIAFGDFGFYFPGTMGDWSTWVSWILCYLLILFLGLMFACLNRQFRLAILQIFLPVLLVSGTWLYRAVPDRSYDASQYQFLIGKTREEVEQTLGRRRFRGSGLDGFQGGTTPAGEEYEYGYQIYNGMEILYSNEQRVVKVRKFP